MGEITATLKINEKKDWIYWLSKPANRYELTYSSDTDFKPHTIYNASLGNVLRQFFLKTGSFNHTYHLKVDSSISAVQAQQATRKFKKETEHLTRRLLGLGSDQPLPIGKDALGDALKASFEKQKADLKQEMQQKTTFMRKARNVWGGLGVLSIIGLGIVGVLVAASVIVFPPAIIIPSAILGTLLFGSTIEFGTSFALHKSLVKDTQKIDTLDNPFSIREKYPPPRSAKTDMPFYPAKTNTGQLLEPNPTPDVQIPIPVATPNKPGSAGKSSSTKKG